MFAVELENVSFSYDKQEILKDVNLKIKSGDFVGIIGPNGSGKTTLIKLILGIVKPKKGKIKVFGEDINKFNKWDLIGYVPQKISTPFSFPATVEEIISASYIKDERILKRLNVHKILKRKFVELSGGEQQKVLLSLALLKNPKLLILDEPTVSIDFQTQTEFYEILKEENKKGKTIILVSHDVGMIYKHVETVVFVNRGICCITEPKEEIYSLYGKSFRKFYHKHK